MQLQTAVNTAQGVPNSKQDKKRSHGQTGPKSLAGKSRSRWNALKDGATAKSSVLPFEDERQYRRHIKATENALRPQNYIEEQLVREYAENLWRITRHENRGAYEREKILTTLTPAMAAQMLGFDEQKIACAPDYLLNLRYRISKHEEQKSVLALSQYHDLMKNAKGIANFNLVWRQYPSLFEALATWVGMQPQLVPIMGATGKGLDLYWQQQPKKLVALLEMFVNHLFYVAHFEQLKPKIRIWMESWFFLQRAEMRRLEQGEQLLIKERNHGQALLDRLMRLRKSGLCATGEPKGDQP